MEELAALSGISRPTLSKYFNDPGSVRQSTLARIEEALERFDYRPNVFAMNANRRLTRNIGVVVPYLSDPFFAEIARNMERLCADAGFHPILFSSDGDPDREAANLDSVQAIKPAGALIAPLGRRTHRDMLEGFCESVPTVLFDCDVEGVGDAFYGSNKSQGIGIMLDYLMSGGEAPAFFEMQDAPNPNANKLRDAYETQMRARGQEPMILRAQGQGWNFEEIGYLEGARMIDERRLPTNTVLCSNDRLAIGFLAASYERGLRVGKGPGHALRVAGNDNHPFARFACPSLTTVGQDYDAISGASFDKLLSILESGRRPETASERDARVFDGHLVKRNSA